MAPTRLQTDSPTTVPNPPEVEPAALAALRWELLLKEYDEIRAADRAYVQHLAALISVVIAIATAVAITLEQFSDHPHQVPGWAWLFVPLPMLGILALLVFLQTASRVRSRYGKEIEEELQKRVASSDGFLFPTLLVRARASWHGRFAPSGISFTVALLSIFAVVVVLNGAAVRVTHPAWVQQTGGAIEAVVWVLMAVVFARSLLTDREAKRAEEAARDVFKAEDPTPNTAEQAEPVPA
jgi:MFS family permease